MSLAVQAAYQQPVPRLVFARPGMEVATLVRKLGMTIGEGEEAAAVLRKALAPLAQQGEILEALSLTGRAGGEFARFLGGEALSQRVLRVLDDKAAGLLWVIGRLTAQKALNAVDLRGILSGRTAPEALDAVVTRTGQWRRDDVLGGRRSVEAFGRRLDAFDAAVGRFRAMLAARAAVAAQETPTALSLTDILANSERYRTQLGGRRLPVALLDMSGTMRTGWLPVPWAGQVSLEWGLESALMYGPQEAVGLGWVQAGRGILRGLRLRKEEQTAGSADRSTGDWVMGEIVKGLDGERAKRSLDRWLMRQQGRGFSRWMMDEVGHLRRMGALIIVITADPQHVAERISHEFFGIPRENVFGFTIELHGEGPLKGKGTGKFVWPHGETKVGVLEERVRRPLREAEIEFDLALLATDSDSDLPLAEQVWTAGGIVFGKDPPREQFARTVYDRGGMVVREGGAATKVGVFDDPVGGSFSYEIPTTPVRPAWHGPLAHHAMRAAQATMGLVLAKPLAEVVTQAVTDRVRWDLGLVSGVPTIAAAGFAASFLSFFFAPETGPVSRTRRILWQGAVPLAAAAAFGGLTGDFGPWYVDAPAAAATALAVSAATDLTTAGGWGIGLRKRGDEVTQPARKILGYFNLRAIELTAFRLLTRLIEVLRP